MAENMPPPEGVIHFDPDHKVRPQPKPNGASRRMLRYEWEPLALNQSWLVKNRMARTGVGAIIGRGYTGKTQALIDLACGVITERNWAAAKVMRPGGVIYFSAEGGLGVMRSWQSVKELVIKPWFAHAGETMPAEFPFALVVEMPPLLPNMDGAIKWYIDCIEEAKAVFKRKFGIETSLAIFDTLAKIAGFKDESNNAECTNAFKTLDRIAQTCDLFALTADHLPKDENAKLPRGGSAKYDAADSIMRIGTNGDGGQNRTLYVDKVRDGEGGQEVPFRLSVIETGVDTDGDPITAVRMTWLDEMAHNDRGPGRKSSRLPDMLLAISDCYDADLGKHIVVAGRRIFAVPGSEVRRNYFRRAGGAGQTEHTLLTTYTRTLKKMISSNVLDAYRFDTGEEFVWKVGFDETRRNSTN